MSVIWFPLSATLDTMDATDCLSDTLLPFHELKRATRRYILGEGGKPHFPMPAIPMQIERMEDGWPVLVEMYRTDSGSSSVTIMHIGSAADLYNW